MQTYLICFRQEIPLPILIVITVSQTCDLIHPKTDENVSRPADPEICSERRERVFNNYHFD